MNNLITVCSRADVDTWAHCAPEILEKIKSDRYILIVPDREVPIFKICTPGTFEIIQESSLSSAFHQKLKDAIPSSNSDRFGWYLQQFLKIAALIACSDDEISLIWDADTLPRENLDFESNEGEILFFQGSEEHKPYFACIKSLLGLEKIVSPSFIAQCFPARGSWIKAFIAEVELRFEKPWYEALIDVIDFSESSGFSEYETLGTYISHRFPEQFSFVPKPWCRRGYKAVGDITKVNSIPARLILSKYSFISFEKWDRDDNRAFPARLFSLSRVVNVLSYFPLISGCAFRKNRSDSISFFLELLFSTCPGLHVIQVGANDGVQNDPLRGYFSVPGGYSATLIEPLPYYVEKLRELYCGRDDIHIEMCAVGDADGEMTLFYIPPEIADQMNGDGPLNNWAHGQGSFDRKIIEYWIRRNSFRGEDYRRQTDFFISSITSENVPVRRVADFQRRDVETLLCIDAQGFELTVLQGVDWSTPPAYVIFEDDRGGGGVVEELLVSKNYYYLCGDHDKVFAWLG